MVSSTTSLSTGLLPIAGCLGIIFDYISLIEIPVVSANSVDPNQRLHSAASDLGLYCLSFTLLGLFRL